ncbi:MAG: hypothetical protein UT29_C0004G0014 [Candidatus Yanofskybacteria bacterium GW2011_GWA1_39_13]|uniref:Uncharacterized protein n=1 Tax=Yanofskybacteria sp. (strain GW2011_GWA1_39_13) TaxID=1619019 RepID=A0A0G0MPG6_YANXG|nr:MAG: hypothetical protein UT29_C0004G0014 [Candidatus Yanofskybacteria bacterium GW2011_GWA1_39_13]
MFFREGLLSDNNASEKASRKVGSFLAIMIIGVVRMYIAEVVQEEPLILKVKESGPYSKLKFEDFVVFEKDSLRLQGDDLTASNILREAVQRGKPFVSGLERLGITDGTLREILPVDVAG